MSRPLTVMLSVAIMILAGTLRLYRLDSPVADWHSWRQADTAAVARNFLKFGMDPLKPRFDDLSNIPSGRDNLNGYRMVEFPFYQMTGVLLSRLQPSIAIEVWLRLVTVASSVVSIGLVMLLANSLMGRMTALLSGLTYAVLPYAVFYGRSILPEQFMVFWALLSLYVFLMMRNRRYRTLIGIGGSLAAAIALLVKPMAAFLLVPVPALLISAYGWNVSAIAPALVYAALAFFPLWWWRSWIAQFPEGIPAYSWLFNANAIRFKGAWFHWIFAERIGNIILGYWGLVPLAVGLLIRPEKKEGWFMPFLLLGSLLYVTVIASGNVQHDYYQVLLLPVISLTVGRGLTEIIRSRRFGSIRKFGVIAGIGLGSLAFSWYTVRGYYWINRPEIVEAGKEADRLLPAEAKVIAPYNGDTTFLYQTNRQGWPIGFDIPKKIADGATHYVTVSPTDSDLETKELAETYTVMVRNDKYAIIDLTKLNPGN